MANTVIIIPSRLKAKRLPNKPLIEIKGIPMIIHVMNRAKESKVGEVIVATPDIEIFNIVKKNGGEVVLTSDKHMTGSDRVYEVYSKVFQSKSDFIINLQGDVPNIKPNSISKLNKLMANNSCDIGTLASNLQNKKELLDVNVVKAEVEKDLKNNAFLKVKDFFRTKKKLNNEKIYHHIGCYAFTNDALSRYVKLSRSKKEIERNLEQMRAMENNFIIKVGFSDSVPLSVDTTDDLIKITKEMG